MNNINSLFFALLRSALWGNNEDLPKELSEKEAFNLFKVVEEQSVSGLVFDAIIRNEMKIPQSFVFEAVGIEGRIKLVNKHLNDELKEFVKLSLRDYVVVKGQTIAAIYPDASLRMPGDIDFLVHDYESAKVVIEREWNVELPVELVDREYAFEHGNATYEIHDKLIVFGCRKHQRYWDKLMSHPFECINVSGVLIPTLSPTNNAIYVFVHLFFHFVREGVSLRQLCDWAMVLHHYKNEIDRDGLLMILLHLNLFDAYCAFGTILIDYLGLPLSEFPLPLGVNDRVWQKRIMDDIFKSGNFGKLRHHARSSWRYKVETMGIVVRNSIRYYRLCPSEVGSMIPRLVKGNLKILFSRNGGQWHIKGHR